MNVADGVADDCHLIGIVIRDLPRIHHGGAAAAWPDTPMAPSNVRYWG